MLIERQVRMVEAFVRAHAADPYPRPWLDQERASSAQIPDRLPKVVLCFDTETTVDESQRLNFGVASFYRTTWVAGSRDWSVGRRGSFTTTSWAAGSLKGWPP